MLCVVCGHLTPIVIGSQARKCDKCGRPLDRQPTPLQQPSGNSSLTLDFFGGGGEEAGRGRGDSDDRDQRDHRGASDGEGEFSARDRAREPDSGPGHPRARARDRDRDRDERDREPAQYDQHDHVDDRDRRHHDDEDYSTIQRDISDLDESITSPIFGHRAENTVGSEVPAMRPRNRPA